MKFIDTHLDAWKHVQGEDGPVSHPTAAANLLLTLAQWHAVRDTWPADLPVGVEVPNTAAIEELKADLPRIALVALHFPKWVDGRAYSQARVLRTRLAFKGEIRATGEVLVDMLQLLQRCGFDAAQLRHDQSLEHAQRALGFFAAFYQGDVSATQPVFKRASA